MSATKDDLDSIRVVNETTAIDLLGISLRTWRRLREQGDLPPKTRLSANRTGYRVADLKTWLDARRIDPATEAA
jgi:predicted DNA-binding transcriptional regulator AlpA